MFEMDKEVPQRVLIASANPLFGKGLEKMLQMSTQSIQIRLFKTMEETMFVLADWHPDLLIVDDDDRTIDRSAFLSYFVSGDNPMQVMLVSLRASGEVVVFDRRTLTTSQAEDWLHLSLQSPKDDRSPEGKEE